MNTARRKELNEERLQTLEQSLHDDVRSVLAALEEEGWFPFVAQAFRSPELQDALYAQGREPLAEVNRLRAVAGEDPITEDDNKIVTKAKSGHSLHEKGKAVDIVNYPDGNIPEWDNMKFYEAANKHFEELGWEWGGAWTGGFKDYPHFEED